MVGLLIYILGGKQNLFIVNGESNKCEDLWTREQGEEKSITDYVITTKKDLNTIKNNENRQRKRIWNIQGRNIRYKTMQKNQITML